MHLHTLSRASDIFYPWVKLVHPVTWLWSCGCSGSEGRNDVEAQKRFWSSPVFLSAWYDGVWRLWVLLQTYSSQGKHHHACERSWGVFMRCWPRRLKWFKVPSLEESFSCMLFESAVKAILPLFTNDSFRLCGRQLPQSCVAMCLRACMLLLDYMRVLLPIRDLQKLIIWQILSFSVGRPKIVAMMMNSNFTLLRMEDRWVKNQEMQGAGMG